MTKFQRNVLYLAVIVILAMLVYPPFVLKRGHGVEINMGYGWLLDPPKRDSLTASVNYPLLLAQWVGVLLVTGILWLVGRERPRKTTEKRIYQKQQDEVYLAKLKGVRGWLLLLCIILTIASPVINLAGLVSLNKMWKPYFDAFPGIYMANLLRTILVSALIIFSIYSGAILWNKEPGAVKTAKVYLWTYLSYAVLYPVLFLVLAGLPKEDYVDVLKTGIPELIGQIGFFVVWYSYLLRSKRVRLTFGT